MLNDIERLRERIEMLEDVIGVHSTMTDRIEGAFGLKPRLAKMLGMLYQRSYVTRDGLYTVLYGDRHEVEQPAMKILDVHACMLRRHLRGLGIEFETKFGIGWQMSSSCKARVKEIISQSEQPTQPVGPTIRERRLAFLEGA